ncbi:hypothetical protein ACFL18_02520 [Patescibacteria group bacterium]
MEETGLKKKIVSPKVADENLGFELLQKDDNLPELTNALIFPPTIKYADQEKVNSEARKHVGKNE